MTQQRLDGLLIPHGDRHFGEYLVPCDEVIAHITGFTGSAGFLIITKDKSALFVDGRYTLQAQKQVSKDEFSLHTLGTEVSWLHNVGTAEKNASFAYDPWCFSSNMLERFQHKNLTLTALKTPLPLWQSEPRPSHPKISLTLHPIRFAGKESVIKIQKMRQSMEKKGMDCILLQPESWSWLLNIRGGDLAYTPISQGFLYIDKEIMHLFLHTLDQPREVFEYLKTFHVECSLMEDLPKWMNKKKDTTFGYDKDMTPLAVKNMFECAIPFEDPCILPKAIKCETEIKGAIHAHIKDALAWVHFWHALEQKLECDDNVSELDIDAMLLHQRKLQPDFVCPSFATIAGSGPNGAIVHYRATEEDFRILGNDELLLIDSGGQYKDGTTDITRVLALGTPTDEMKKDFTTVLKGHIAIASLIFPKGTSGAQIDALARAPLWRKCKDFAHGTGHGVGSFLSVHEGPQRISKYGHAPLHVGMILSNEPGYYLEGKYGIRIENLVYVREVSGDGWFEFENLTLVPLDLRLVDISMLTKEEVSWLNTYHEHIVNTLTPHLSKDMGQWLKKKCCLVI